MESRKVIWTVDCIVPEEEELTEVEVTKENGSKFLFKKFKKCSNYS